MARLARIVVPGQPHHVVQRGNRGGDVFFAEGDRLRYLALVGEAARTSGTEVWAYCLMTNHVHFIAVPSHPDGLRALFADAHRRYTRYVNAAHGWTGHLWQGRFGSVAMDEDHLASALRYVSLNPVRAGLVPKAEDWPYSSVRAHLGLARDPLLTLAPVRDRIPDFAALIEQEQRPDEFAALRKAESIGRPLGSEAWLDKAEAMLGRKLRPGRPGRRV